MTVTVKIREALTMTWTVMNKILNIRVWKVCSEY